MDLAQKAREALENKHGQDIRLLDVRDISDITDYTLVVSGSSPPHLKALLGEVQHVLKAKGVHRYRKAGTPDCGRIVLDYFDVVIHIFSTQARQYYAIEELWETAPLLK